jgi:hypothetical protein
MTDPAAYVREVERYLCQKNGGHLVRVVGPAFELVREWVSRGVPLKVAFRGIDRCCARQTPTRVRRRPMRIEFCEADVLDAFDEWRRAVGVAGTDEAAARAVPKPRTRSLAEHIERALARLAHARGPQAASTTYHHQIDAIVRELEAMASQAPRARGDVRARLVQRLAELDAIMVAAATEALDRPRAEALRREAADELAPFGARMSDGVRARAHEGAFRRLVREAAALPTLTCE